MINGILVVDKDKGMTSADVVYHLRKALHIRKIGHAGTLDPDVTGVLPIAIGQATKLIELMHTQNKKYVGTAILGYATDSYDISGKVLKSQKLTDPIAKEEIEQQMQKFVGQIEQVPPIYSAVRVNGKHLYEYAREGIEVERPKRQVQIFAYDTMSEPVFDSKTGFQEFDFQIECSKGTYVRSLVNDLGTRLGVPAVMKTLRRTASSGFTIDQAVKLDQIIAHPDEVTNFIQPIDAFFKDYETCDLTSGQWLKVKNGNSIPLKTNAKKVALRYNNSVKAIYQKDDAVYRPDLMLLQNE
ncbi:MULTISPECIES: tRNA pseudouridine(55) synthase TruB [Lactobacillus]|uniref:tRNA pseudouridine(55) synthase TruB n=1 Tax=Lactobacillus TaxID=1578 RepID=UPI001C6A84AC|nr:MULTISPECIES: tRNA pseudouridine(55) synthase TruB [Lactobacillus]MCO6532757.1 tRNA pseudouridine(55) synthase TruB [Lactobacillus sp.]MCT6820934.1 tRNA pseudouridine(55) synthase TruB [Lactobacillus panisapium]MCT6854306.1 tRNA pseudouridine(55) synthase TruB [Lactobacillus panisapium]MCT6865791.1 tRNA pseudouridine(55) synthase TruB [Lactobacillus panisapium]QYN58749.1 tRNA pseudouridine(55) synthase TruB [Lactobacillus panisapium]